MHNISDIAEANEILMRYVPMVKEITGKNITLERMWPLLEKVGNPEARLKVIHLAGTSGKTSTAYFIASILRQTGASVGLTVSPHVDSVTERVQVNGQQLSGVRFCEYLSEFMNLIGDMQPTYFELIVAFAYWVFAKRNVDYAVIETGLGGMHDSTNVVHSSDKVCVITDIGFDHMNILGNTLSSIAAQKAGIIHQKNQVFMYRQSGEVMDIVNKRVKDRQAKLNLVPEKFDNSSILPLFQERNWNLAFAASEHVIERDGLNHLTDEKLTRLQQIQVPGRMDTRVVDGKTIIMDGAHNQQKMAAFVESFMAKYPDQKAVVLLAMKEGKDFGIVVDEVLKMASELILTNFKVTQDIPSKSISPELIAEYCSSKGFNNFKVIADQQDAYITLKNNSAKILVVTGSFYLLSQIRALQD